MQVNTVDELISDLRQGRMVVLVDDDADSHNEGVVMVAAEHADAKHINFMARQARGLVCLTLTEERCRQLDLPPMVDDAMGEKSNFTLSIEAAEGIDTGISAADRARTVQAAVAPHARPADIVQPGHIFPLVAKPGGVLRRAGHTEAGVDLARMAGFEPAALIVEIMNEDGTMARRPQLEEFAAKHDLHMGTIADLIEYRALHEQSVELRNSKTVNTEWGELELHTFLDLIDDSVHYALSRGEIHEERDTLVRVQDVNTLRDVLGTKISEQEPGWSYRLAMEHIAREERGVVVMLSQPMSAEQSLEAVMRFPDPPGIGGPGSSQGVQNYRLIGTGSQILKRLGVGRMRLMSAPVHFNALSGFNLEVTEFVQP